MKGITPMMIVVMIIMIIVVILLAPVIYNIITYGWSRQTCMSFFNALTLGITGFLSTITGGFINPAGVVCAGVGT